MVLWAGNFIVVKSALAVLPPVGFTFLRFLAGVGDAARPPPLARGQHRAAAARHRRRSLGLGGARLRRLPDPVDDGPARRSRPATRRCSSPRRRSSSRVLAVVARSDVLTPVKLAGVLVSFAGVAIVIASGPGLSLGGSLVGEVITLAAAFCWSVYTAFGAPFLRRHSPLRATAWATVAGTARARPNRASSSSRASISSSSGLGSRRGDPLLGLLAAGIANVVVLERGQGRRARPGPPRSSSSSRRWPSSSPRCSSASRSGPARCSVAWSSSVASCSRVAAA